MFYISHVFGLFLIKIIIIILCSCRKTVIFCGIMHIFRDCKVSDLVCDNFDLYCSFQAFMRCTSFLTLCVSFQIKHSDTNCCFVNMDAEGIRCYLGQGCDQDKDRMEKNKAWRAACNGVLIPSTRNIKQK